MRIKEFILKAEYLLVTLLYQRKVRLSLDEVIHNTKSSYTPGKNSKVKRKVNEEDLCALLQSLYSAVLSGKDPISGLIRSYELFPDNSSLKPLLAEFKDSINKGEKLEDSLRQFCSGFPTQEMKCFEATLLLTLEHGTSLAPILQRLLKAIRQRQSFKQKVDSALALQKISIYGIVLCTVLVIGIQLLNNHAEMLEALNSKTGFICYCASFCLISIGLFLMSKLMGRNFD